MTIAELMEKMIAYTVRDSLVPHHDINHFMKVWAFARTIGRLEGLDDTAQFTLEAAAILHDIACPLCRRKYGNTEGRHQEEEGEGIARQFLDEADLSEDVKKRIVYLVAHHHTYANVSGQDYRILLEADYLVNADEDPKYARMIDSFREKVFRTEAGKRLLDEMYHAG